MKTHKSRRINRSLGSDILILSILILFASLMVVPLVYAVSSSLKPLSELWIFPPRFFVSNPTLRNFKDLLLMVSDSWVPFSRYIFNTVFVTVAGTVGHVILASMCAYAIAKIRFYGSRLCFNIIVYSLMFSAAVTVIPNFLIMRTLHLVDTYFALILPAFAAPLGVYLMKQFLETMVHDSVLEAAKIDGAGEWRIFWRIVMPMVKPAWLTLIIFSFQGLWSTPGSILIQSEELKSLNYAVSQFAMAGTQAVASAITRTGVAMAASVLMMIPPILLFLFTQSNVVETMSTSGMKD